MTMFREQDRELRADFEKSGEEERFKTLVKNRIDDFIEDSKGRRRLGNLFGILPKKRRDLFFWQESGFGVPFTFVAGKFFPFDHYFGDEMVEQVVNGYEPIAKEPEVIGEDQPNIRTTMEFLISHRVRVRRISYRENRRLHIGDAEEFVPHSDPRFCVRWEVLRVD